MQDKEGHKAFLCDKAFAYALTLLLGTAAKLLVDPADFLVG